MCYHSFTEEMNRCTADRKTAAKGQKTFFIKMLKTCLKWIAPKKPKALQIMDIFLLPCLTSLHYEGKHILILYSFICVNRAE